jgi:5'(3')-deoxyribonucleotidase
MTGHASHYVVVIALVLNDVIQSILERINVYDEALLPLDNKCSQEMKDRVSELNKKILRMKEVMFPIIKRYL